MFENNKDLLENVAISVLKPTSNKTHAKRKSSEEVFHGNRDFI